MVKRRLTITPELWVQTLTRTQPWTFRITRNALPEDARCVGLEESVDKNVIYMWVTSAVFQESDPVDLPSPVFVKESGNG